MPLGDKTGPSATGPLTGRGFGRCTGKKHFGRGPVRGMRTTSAGKAGKSIFGQSWFWTSVVLPLAAAIVNDLTNEDSTLKQLVSRGPKRLGNKVKGYLARRR